MTKDKAVSNPMLDLLPCPFCGAKAKCDEIPMGIGNARYRISCTECDLMSSRDGYATAGIAIVRWNTRAVASDHVRAWREAVERVFVGYIDSYRMLANDGDGKVHATSVRVDLSNNIMPAILALAHPSPARPASDQGAVREALELARSEFIRQKDKCRSDGDADYFEKALVTINAALSTPAIGTPDAQWQTICDSYAAENQRLSDELAAARLAVIGTPDAREALELLSLQQRGRARAFRLLDKVREKSDPSTLAAADAYEECGNELLAALAEDGK